MQAEMVGCDPLGGKLAVGRWVVGCIVISGFFVWFVPLYLEVVGILALLLHELRSVLSWVEGELIPT